MNRFGKSKSPVFAGGLWLLAEFSFGSVLFPRYSVQSSLEYDSLITLVYNDFFNAGGEDKSYALSFNWNRYA